uniref:HDC11892 n=1 Tax=Drosophila melanogaster TaxID=7227 RepID=Q6IKP7_DROME|nr:TPA_inf: HDC11892 [Drosophila melanogaster]
MCLTVGECFCTRQRAVNCSGLSAAAAASLPTSMRPLIIGFRHRANTVGTDYMDSGSQNKQFGHFYLLIQSVDLGSRNPDEVQPISLYNDTAPAPTGARLELISPLSPSRPVKWRCLTGKWLRYFRLKSCSSRGTTRTMTGRKPPLEMTDTLSSSSSWAVNKARSA